jgi:hypothetical protein
VLAQICTQCGEAYFDAKTTKELYAKASESFSNGAELEIINLNTAA